MKVLDKGLINLVCHNMGDMLVVNAARASYNNTDWFKEECSQGDIRLINFLAREGHKSPFYHPQLTFLVKAPIFTHRQWERHNVGTAMNSESGRYIIIQDEFYLPEYYRKQSTDNKQGSSGIIEDVQIQKELRELDEQFHSFAYELYRKKLSLGVAKEQARGTLPQDMYVSFLWTASLQAVAHFIKLRSDSHAQFEIQEYARAMRELTIKEYPISLAALEKYNGSTWTKT